MFYIFFFSFYIDMYLFFKYIFICTFANITCSTAMHVLFCVNKDIIITINHKSHNSRQGDKQCRSCRLCSLSR